MSGEFHNWWGFARLIISPNAGAYCIYFALTNCTTPELPTLFMGFPRTQKLDTTSSHANVISTWSYSAWKSSPAKSWHNCNHRTLVWGEKIASNNYYCQAWDLWCKIAASIVGVPFHFFCRKGDFLWCFVSTRPLYEYVSWVMTVYEFCPPHPTYQSFQIAHHLFQVTSCSED